MDSSRERPRRRRMVLGRRLPGTHDPLRVCSFCDAAETPTRIVFLGSKHGVCICADCVALCAEVLASDASALGQQEEQTP